MSAGLAPAAIGDVVSAPDERQVVRIGEWERSDDTYELTARDRRVLESEINTDATRIGVEYTPHGEARFHARQFVGVVSLPDGPMIQISPKAAGENLLHLLQYSREVTSTTVDQPVGLEAGASFVEAIAALFTTELETVLQRGLHKAYRTQEATRSNVRGQIELQRQLQRQGSAPTAFECRYSDQTRDTVANQAILYAGMLLKRLVSDPDLRQKLDWQTKELRRSVALHPISPQDLSQVELTRLNDYYADLLRLTEPIIRNMHIDNLDAGFRESFSLLVNMNTVFERAIERAVGDAVAGEEHLTVTPRAKTTTLVQGTPSVTLYPDFIIESTEGDQTESILVGDMKWKTGSVDNSDIYQMTSYVLAHDAPGILCYPGQEGTIETNYTIDSDWPLSVVEISTSHSADRYSDFVEALESNVQSMITSAL
jgi:5-methylcytosine-specific restriction enzyme subunit McrC